MVFPARAQHRTRAEEIQAQRHKKQAKTQPDESPRVERLLNAVRENRLTQRFSTDYRGLTLVPGGLATGQGFALGPQWRHSNLAGRRLDVRVSARYAFSKAYLLDAEVALPQLAGEKTRLEFYGLHRNYPRLDFYGAGSDSRKRNRTHYRLEDTLLETRFLLNPLRRLRLGVSGGMLRVNTKTNNRVR